MRKLLITLMMAAIFTVFSMLAQESSTGAEKKSDDTKAVKKTSRIEKGSSKYLKALKAQKTDKAKSKNIFIITNKTLTSTPEEPVKPRTGRKEEQDVEIPEAVDSQGRGEKYWRSIYQRARTGITNLENRLSSLQSEINKLQNDYYRWDDPEYRDAVIKPKWDQAVKDLETTRSDLEKARENLETIERDARKSGALPGWFR